jgi:hypothetical protein
MSNFALFESVGKFESRLPAEGHMCQKQNKIRNENLFIKKKLLGVGGPPMNNSQGT